MALFNLFKNRKNVSEVPSPQAFEPIVVADNQNQDADVKTVKPTATPTPVPTLTPTPTLSSSPSTSPAMSTPSSKSLTVSYATGWPIDLIYGNLHKNYEDKGYSDAMLNSNLTFRDMNMSIIRNKILMIFREVNLKYNGMKRDLDTRIETCNAAGLLTTVAELEKQMAIIISHTTELARLEEDFRNNANEASVPLMSYECGFLRGVSAIAMSTPPQVPSSPQVSLASFFNSNRETA